MLFLREAGLLDVPGLVLYVVQAEELGALLR